MNFVDNHSDLNTVNYLSKSVETKLNDPPKMVHRSTITLIIAFYMLTAELK